MARKPLFSVVIPTYGRPEFLERALESVLSQTVDDWECIVAVDGGEAPPTHSDPRIRVVVRSVNGGAGAARNTALENARGSNIAFLDDDDTWLPERLEIALEGLRRAPVAVCFGFTRGELAWQGSWEGAVYDTLLEGKVPSLNCVAIRGDVARAVPFDERMRAHEDVDWLLRVAQKADFTTVPRPGFVHRNAGTFRPFTLERLKSMYLLMEIHASYFTSHPRAAVRRWQMIGDAAFRVGRMHEGRKAYFRAFRAEPRRGTLKAWLRTLLRGQPTRTPSLANSDPVPH